MGKLRSPLRFLIRPTELEEIIINLDNVLFPMQFSRFPLDGEH